MRATARPIPVPENWCGLGSHGSRHRKKNGAFDGSEKEEWVPVGAIDSKPDMQACRPAVRTFGHVAEEISRFDMITCVDRGGEGLIADQDSAGVLNAHDRSIHYSAGKVHASCMYRCDWSIARGTDIDPTVPRCPGRLRLDETTSDLWSSRQRPGPAFVLCALPGGNGVCAGCIGPNERGLAHGQDAQEQKQDSRGPGDMARKGGG